MMDEESTSNTTLAVTFKN